MLVLTDVTPRLMRLLRLARLDRVLLTTGLTDVGSRPGQVQPIGLSA
jgi:hypothetical protein